MLTNHCISHIKDVDGICSSALTLAAKGGTFRLTDYDELFEALNDIPEGTTSLVLCDLGTDATKLPAFSQRLSALKATMSVTYIDHHYVSAETKKALGALPITFVHNTEECAAMLTYLTFKQGLPAEAAYLALFGAVTDYMDTSPTASKMMERFDRQFVLLESTMLSYALAKNGGANGLLDRAVRGLTTMKKPHEIEGVSELAVQQLATMLELSKEVQEKGKTIGKLAYIRTDETSTGNAAKLLLGAFDVVVGASYKEKEGRKVEMSLRGTSECPVHLGETISMIAARHNGNGGGHYKAAGCSVPADDVMGVLEELSSALSLCGAEDHDRAAEPLRRRLHVRKEMQEEVDESSVRQRKKIRVVEGAKPESSGSSRRIRSRVRPA